MIKAKVFVLVTNIFVVIFAAQEHPTLTLKNVEMYTKDTIKILETNKSFIVPKYFSELQYECNSTYPTRWTFGFNTYLDEDLKEIPRIEKRKEKMKANETNSIKNQYTFTSTVTLKYKKTDSMQNLTCRGTGKNKDFLSSVWSKEISNNHISIKLVTGKTDINDNDDEPLTVIPEPMAKRFGKDPECLLKIRINIFNKTYSCQSNSPDVDLESFLILCGNPDECDSFTRQSNCIHNSIEVTEKPCENNQNNCVTFRPNPKPGVIICTDSVSSIGMKYQLVRRLSESNLSQTIEHLVVDENKTELKNFKLIKLEAKDKNIYDEMEHTFVCTVPMYYYAHGIEWKLYANTLPDLKPINSTHADEVENSAEQLYTSTVKLVFNKTVSTHQILFCVAPLWNEEILTTTEGINITVLDSYPPRNTRISKIEAKGVYRCETFAQPPANVSWFAVFDEDKNETTPLDATSYNISSGDNDNWSEISVIHFPSKKIKLKCAVKNFKGEDKKAAWFDNRITTSLSYLYLIIFGVGGILLLFLLALFVIYKIRQQRACALTDADIDEFVNGIPDESNNPILLPYNIEFEIPKENLLIDDAILGSGFFGTVRKGRCDGKVVAVKSVKKSADAMHFKSLFSELKILCFIGKHPHLVNLVGACTKNIRNREMYIVVEYCSNGNLLKLLRNCRTTFVDHYDTETSPNTRQSTVQYVNAIGKKISTRDLVKWSAEIANGMEFLSSKHVVHGDLAARNILVTEDMTAKVCDFGLSKQLFEYSVYVQKPQNPLPLKWMAVESLRDLEFSLESDIWSFGITLWEVFTLGQVPYPGIEWNYTSWKLLKGGYKMEKPDYMNNLLYELMLRCWDLEPKRRIPFGALKAAFDKELRSFNPRFTSTYL